MPPKHNLHTHTYTRTAALASGCLCLRFCCFVCQLIWKLQQQQERIERRCLMRKTLRYAPFSTCNTLHCLPLSPLPLSYTPLCCVCVCVCLPTCVAHCAHCLHISPKTVHCAYLNFTARCGFSSKRFHLPTCCARPLDYHKRPTSPSPSTSSPLPHWPLARHTHHLPAMFARNSWITCELL